MMDDFLLRGLTDAQREAVEHVDGPLLVLAGPGSGKTRVITHRIARLLCLGVPARNILALTFTNKAADEMKGRIEALAPGQPVWVSTFHRFCARQLREHAALVGLPQHYTIYDTSDSQSALKRALEQIDFDSGRFTPQQIAHRISWAKNNMVTAAEFVPRPGHPLDAIVARAYPAYAKALLNAGAVDYDDLLLHVATLLAENPELRADLDARWQYVLVDEYQDTNLVQYAIVRALSQDHPNLAVTGDPDQSIYGWRGANLGNILDFERDYPDVHVVRLERNYRSTKRILSVAARLIQHNRRRKEKALFTENAEGRSVRLTTYVHQQQEAESIAAYMAAEISAGRRRPRDFAVFYRVNALSRTLEDAMRQHALPYQIVRGLEFYQRKEIKDVLAYLALVNNPKDDVAILRVINTPPRGIGKVSLERLTNHAARRGLPLFEAARESGMVESLPKKTAVQLARFVAMFDHLALLSGRPVEELLGHVLADSGYRVYLELSDDEEDQDRLANIEELLTAARQYDEQDAEGGLEGFLERVCLVNDTDDWDDAGDRVTLMTLHASKGLEFPVVFIIALEDGLIPHERSRDEPAQLEEERRLLFVGLTRAEEELHLSRAAFRQFRGQGRFAVPSSFLFELPLDELEQQDFARHVTFGVPVYGGAKPDAVESANDGEMADELGADSIGVDDEIFPEDEMIQDEPWNRAEQPAASAAPLAATLQTAAELAGHADESPVRVSPDEFAQGMLVRHPTYGLGKIIALGGVGTSRKATVAFVNPPAERSFVLAHSPLSPARRG